LDRLSRVKKRGLGLRALSREAKRRQMKRKIRKELPLPNRVLIRDSLLLLGLFISDVPFLESILQFP